MRRRTFAARFGRSAPTCRESSSASCCREPPRWPTSEDGKWYWKCDTSSDELDGHYFFYALYYDLVAKTDAEKRPVRDVVVAITDHLIENGFQLIDHDGKPTRWGRFSPQDLNGDVLHGARRMVSLSLPNGSTMHTDSLSLDALGSPTRRALLRRLAEGPLPVGELAAPLPISRPAVSQQLRLLEQARLVGFDVRGRRRLYSLQPAGFDDAHAWLDGLWPEALHRFAAIAESTWRER